MSESIRCVGEVLWDAMPGGLFLGGAPQNVAFHLRRLGHAAAPVTRVGDDRLGREARRRMRGAGLDTSFVQTDPELETGFVSVELDAAGVPAYDVVEPVAWDRIERVDGLGRKATVVYGTLAQRSPTSRRTIQDLAAEARLAVYDVNLRPPFIDRAVIDESLRLADHVKLNEDELRQIARWSGWADDPRAAVESLASAYGVGRVCVTRGDRGAALWSEGAWFEHDGYPVDVVDTVGSGDAFLAGLLAAAIEGGGPETALDLACRLGAFVATRSGAMPDYDRADLARR